MVRDLTWYTEGYVLTLSRDNTIVPAYATTIPYVDLYKTSATGSAEFVLRLAENIDPHMGEVNFVLPGSFSPSHGKIYFVMCKSYFIVSASLR